MKIFTEPQLGLGCLENTANESPGYQFRPLTTSFIHRFKSLSRYQHQTERAGTTRRLAWVLPLSRGGVHRQERSEPTPPPERMVVGAPHRGAEHGSKPPPQASGNAAGTHP